MIHTISCYCASLYNLHYFQIYCISCNLLRITLNCIASRCLPISHTILHHINFYDIMLHGVARYNVIQCLLRLHWLKLQSIILQLHTQYYNVVKYVAVYGIVCNCTTLYCNVLQHVVLHCILSHLFTLRYILFNSVTSDYDILNCITLYYIKLHHNTSSYNVFDYTALHYCVALQYMMVSHCTPIRNIILHRTALLRTPLHWSMGQHIKLHHNMLHDDALYKELIHCLGLYYIISNHIQTCNIIRNCIT